MARAELCLRLVCEPIPDPNGEFSENEHDYEENGIATSVTGPTLCTRGEVDARVLWGTVGEDSSLGSAKRKLEANEEIFRRRLRSSLPGVMLSLTS